MDPVMLIAAGRGGGGDGVCLVGGEGCLCEPESFGKETAGWPPAVLPAALLAGHLIQAPLPVPSSRIAVESVSLIPGTTSVLAGGNTHASGNPGADMVAVILQHGF